jgi:hypothetical protein
MNTQSFPSHHLELLDDVMQQITKKFGCAWLRPQDLIDLELRRRKGVKLMDVVTYLPTNEEFPTELHLLERWLDMHCGVELNCRVLIRSGEEDNAWRVVRPRPSRALLDQELDELLGNLPDVEPPAEKHSAKRRNAIGDQPSHKRGPALARQLSESSS